MEYYWINFYKDGNNKPVRGEWKVCEESIEKEKTSYLYTTQLGLTWSHTARIEKKEVEKIAEEHNMSVVEALNCL